MRAVDRIAGEFARRGWRPAQVFASPLRRAQETAAILVARVEPHLAVETLEELDPAGFPEEVVGALVARHLGSHVLLVGHQPLLGGLAAYLTGGPNAELSPGALASLEISRLEARGSGRLLDILHPDHLT
jgi:phosphohistidine phosphatase